MKKASAIFTILFFLIGSFVWAPPAGAEMIDSGNKFCPVSGDKVSEKSFVEYQGKRYGLCCKMCANKFKKDPAKYLAEMAAQEANPNAVSGHEYHMH